MTDPKPNALPDTLSPKPGGGMDSSGGAGGSGGQSGAGYGNSTGYEDEVDKDQGDNGQGGQAAPGEPVDQAVQRSETIEAEDIQFEADRDLIDDDSDAA